MNLRLFVIQVDTILDFTLTRTEKQYDISRLLTEREARDIGRLYLRLYETNRRRGR
jgi:hypothetical protein